MQDFTLLWASGAAQVVAAATRALGRRPDATLLEPFTLDLAEFHAAGVGGMDAAMLRLYAAAVAYEPWFAAGRFDVIMSPVLGEAAPPLGYFTSGVSREQMTRRLTDYVGYTPYHNLVGAPAMSVPLSWSAEGLPIGTMFAGRVGTEGLLFQLAYQLEAAQPWAGRWPRVRVESRQIPVAGRGGP